MLSSSDPQSSSTERAKRKATVSLLRSFPHMGTASIDNKSTDVDGLGVNATRLLSLGSSFHIGFISLTGTVSQAVAVLAGGQLVTRQSSFSDLRWGGSSWL